MWYTGKCPHCGTTVREGHGSPIKRIGTPFRTCYRCHQSYLDENMYEWAILEPLYKFFFYFLANNRGFVYFILLIFAAGGYWLVTLLGSIVWAIVSYLWVKLTKQEAIKESHDRCLQPGYIDALLTHYDKANAKKCAQYQKEVVARQALLAKQAQERAEAERQALLREYNQHCKKCGCRLNALEVVCHNCGTKRY